jgi:hypothetical protein
MKRPILIFALLLMSAPALAAINPVHDPIVAAKPVPLKNVALLLGDRQDKAELPMECSGYYLRPHRPTALSRCN